MTLDDFGGGTQPPTFVPRGRALAMTHGETRVAGRWGVCPERYGLSFASPRDSHKHRLRAFDAYAVSIDVIDNLHAMDVQNVFIVETDTGDVYEYGIEDFRRFGDRVPDEYLDDPLDPQRYHARDDPRHQWPNHAGSFYRESSVDEEDVEFQTAHELEEADG